MGEKVNTPRDGSMKNVPSSNLGASQAPASSGETLSIGEFKRVSSEPSTGALVPENQPQRSSSWGSFFSRAVESVTSVFRFFLILEIIIMQSLLLQQNDLT